MAALAFIAVLIALLTVMIQNLKRTLEEQMAERRILDKILVSLLC